MKILLLSVLACFVAIATICVLNYIEFVDPSRAIVSQQVSSAFDKKLMVTSRTKLQELMQSSSFDKTQSLQIFSRALQFQTTDNLNDFEPFEDLISYLKTALPIFFDTTEEVFDVFNHTGVIYKWKGTEDHSKTPLVLLAHLDVVPAANPEDWMFDPFSGHIDEEEGYIWGRGTMDDKYSAIGLMTAADSLIKTEFVPKRTIYFCFGMDEEVRSDGAMAMRKYLEDQNEIPDLILDEGGVVYENSFPGINENIALICLNEKAGNLFNISVRCQSGHASVSNGLTCAEIVAKMVTQIQEYRFPAHSDYVAIQKFVESIFPRSDNFLHKFLFANLRKFKPVLNFFFGLKRITESLIRTTTVTSQIVCGKIYNVKPRECYFNLDVRRHPMETYEYVKDTILRLIDSPIAEIEIDTIWNKQDGTTADYNTRQFYLIEESIRSVYGESTIVSPSLMIAGTDLQYYKDLSNYTYNFAPLFADSDLNDLDRIHGLNERMGIERYYQVIEFYYSLIYNFNLL